MQIIYLEWMSFFELDTPKNSLYIVYLFQKSFIILAII